MDNFYKQFIGHFKTKPGNITEIGSRDGHHAEELRKLAGLPPNLVYLVEPHPESAKCIRAVYPKAHLYECAIYHKPGILKFNAVPYGSIYDMAVIGTSSLLPLCDIPLNKNNMHIQNWIKVIGITGQMLMELIDAPNLDMVKIDVEGATYEVLKSFGDDIRLIKALHLEFEVLKRWETPHNITDSYKLLQNYGFKEVFSKTAYSVQKDSVWCRIDK